MTRTPIDGETLVLTLGPLFDIVSYIDLREYRPAADSEPVAGSGS